jgi:hypothetical protein
MRRRESESRLALAARSEFAMNQRIVRPPSSAPVPRIRASLASSMSDQTRTGDRARRLPKETRTLWSDGNRPIAAALRARG